MNITLAQKLTGSLRHDSGRSITAWLGCGLAMAGALAQDRSFAAEVFHPKDDRAILLRVPKRGDGSPGLTLREPTHRGNGVAPAADGQVGLQQVRAWLEQARRLGDRRYLGWAEAGLRRWFTATNAPAEAWVLRATLRQSEHDFAGALDDLRVALQIDPTDASAWLTRVTVLQVLGRYDEAKQACLPLLRHATELLAVTCISELGSLNGAAARCRELLAPIVQRSTNAPSSERAWAHTVLGGMDERLGRVESAEAQYRRALQLDLHAHQTAFALADLLLDAGRPGDVAAVLQGRPATDGCLLRRALALQAASPSAGSAAAEEILALRRELEERFAAGDRRGEGGAHDDERARFVLHLVKDAPRAFALAQSNWARQKQPSDLRLLVEAAWAADDRAGQKEAVRWVETTGLEDARLSLLLDRVRKGLLAAATSGEAAQ